MIKRMPLTAQEAEVITTLDKAGLLHDMDKEHFRGKEDVGAIFCPDGRWAIRGVIEPFIDMYDEKNTLCLLPLTEFGGTLILDPDSPLLEKGSEQFPAGNNGDLLLIGKIKKAVKMGYKAFCHINHLPCGMGRAFNIPPMHIIDSLVMAKHRIKAMEGIDKITIASFLQIGDSNGHVRIARIPFEDFLIWRKDNADGASPAMQRMLAML